MDGYDITEQMWGDGWAVDTQGNWSEDHTTGLPGVEVSTADDWIHGWNFSPDRPVHIEIYDTEGGTLLAAFDITAGGDTQFWADYWQHEVDLQPGMYLSLVDTETGKTVSLPLAFLTFDGVDYTADTAWGQANPGTQVVVQANWYFEHYEILLVTDEDGTWYAYFAPLGADLTSEWSLRAAIFDENFSATIADGPRPPEFTASPDGDWLNGNNWTPDGDLTIWIYESEGGALLAGPFPWFADSYGNFWYNLWDQNVDLQPKQHQSPT
jgi:hypothetical protein